MYAVFENWEETPVAYFASLSLAEIWVSGRTNIESARAIATGGTAVPSDYFYIVPIQVRDSVWVKQDLEMETAELEDFLAGYC